MGCYRFGSGVAVHQVIDVDIVVFALRERAAGLLGADFHVKVACVAVFVDGCAFEAVGQVEQFFTGVDGLQADCAPASCSGVEDGVFNWVDGGNGVANGIAYGRWAEQGDNEVVAVFPAP